MTQKGSHFATATPNKNLGSGMKHFIFLAAFMISLFNGQWAVADENLQSVKFRFPIADKHRALIIPLPIIGMDHDPATSDDKTDCLA
jgi:hypothetical protein